MPNKRQKKKNSKRIVNQLQKMINEALDAASCNVLFEQASNQMAKQDIVIKEFKNLQTDNERIIWIQNNL